MTRAAYCETTRPTPIAPSSLRARSSAASWHLKPIHYLQASGIHGDLVPGAIPLIEVANQSEAHTYSPGIPFDRGDLRCYPDYIATLGKGKIVSFPTPAFRELPYKFNNAIGEKFTVKCVRMVSGKIDDATRPVTLVIDSR